MSDMFRTFQQPSQSAEGTMETDGRCWRRTKLTCSRRQNLLGCGECRTLSPFCEGHVERGMTHEATASALGLLSPDHAARLLPPRHAQVKHQASPKAFRCVCSPWHAFVWIHRRIAEPQMVDRRMQEPRQKLSPTRDAKLSARLGWSCGVGVG